MANVVYSESHINPQAQNGALLVAKADGTYSYHSDFKVYITDSITKQTD
jgi:hypothetical protein